MFCSSTKCAHGKDHNTKNYISSKQYSHASVNSTNAVFTIWVFWKIYFQLLGNCDKPHCDNVTMEINWWEETVAEVPFSSGQSHGNDWDVAFQKSAGNQSYMYPANATMILNFLIYSPGVALSLTIWERTAEGNWDFGNCWKTACGLGDDEV